MEAQENNFLLLTLSAIFPYVFISYRLLAVGYQELVWLSVLSFGGSCLLLVAVSFVECRVSGVAVFGC